MTNQKVTVTVPQPHAMGAAGPEWTLTGIWGDRARLVGIPEMDGEPSVVALHVIEDTDPLDEATLWLTPSQARQLAGALVGAAAHAEQHMEGTR